MGWNLLFSGRVIMLHVIDAQFFYLVYHYGSCCAFVFGGDGVSGWGRGLVFGCGVVMRFIAALSFDGV